MNETVYCVVIRNDDGDEWSLKLSGRDQAIKVAEAFQEVMGYNAAKIRVLEGEPKVVWESN